MCSFIYWTAMCISGNCAYMHSQGNPQGHNRWTISWYFLLLDSTFCPWPLSLRYLALYAYKPQKADELELRKGEMYRVTEKCQDGWFKGTSLRTAASGVFPGNYVTPVSRSVSSGLGMGGHYYWCCFSGNSVAYSIVYSSILEASQNAQSLTSFPQMPELPQCKHFYFIFATTSIYLHHASKGVHCWTKKKRSQTFSRTALNTSTWYNWNLCSSHLFVFIRFSHVNSAMQIQSG